MNTPSTLTTGGEPASQPAPAIMSKSQADYETAGYYSQSCDLGVNTFLEYLCSGISCGHPLL